MWKQRSLWRILSQRQLISGRMTVSTDGSNQNLEENVLSDQRLQYYRNLNANHINSQRPESWSKSKSFEAIPGPKPLPVIGNVWRFLPVVGDLYNMDFLEIFRKIYDEFGDIAVLKGLPGRPPVVILYNPADIERLFRNDGAWPHRDGLPSFKHYRTVVRKDIFKDARGLISEQGEEWYKFRAVVNPILMQPRNVLHYVDKMNLVADEFIGNIEHLVSLNSKGEMPEDFINELYKWALESIGVVTMDKHLGLLNPHSKKNPESQEIIEHVVEMFKLMYHLDVQPSIWTWISTPTYRRFVKVLDFLTNVNLKYINEALTKLDSKDNSNDASALEKMLKIDKNVAIAMAMDMMIAGIDTTGRVLGAGLYHLARHPDKQQTLREEALKLLPSKDTPITKDILEKATYLKAVIKEVTRMSPIAVGNLRTTVKDMVLGDYQIPVGSNVMSCNLMLCWMDEYFYKAKDFLPERWLKTTTGPLSYKNTNPFVYAPFGHGPRSCIGKRLANLELEVATLKIIRNFELSWPHEDMVFITTILHGLAKPLKIHVKCIDK